MAMPVLPMTSLRSLALCAARRPIGVVAVMSAALSITAGCAQQRYDPQRATRMYPEELHTTETVRMQVFRDGPQLEIVNATAETYRDVDVWVNQRYTMPVEVIPAGKRVRLSLWEFFDHRGESPVAGGLWRVDPPTPVRLVQIQPAEDEPLIGLITIRPPTDE